MILHALWKNTISKKHYGFFTTLADPPPPVWQKTIKNTGFFFGTLPLGTSTCSISCCQNTWGLNRRWVLPLFSSKLFHDFGAYPITRMGWREWRNMVAVMALDLLRLMLSLLLKRWQLIIKRDTLIFDFLCKFHFFKWNVDFDPFLCYREALGRQYTSTMTSRCSNLILTSTRMTPILSLRFGQSDFKQYLHLHFICALLCDCKGLMISQGGRVKKGKGKKGGKKKEASITNITIIKSLALQYESDCW